MTEDAECKHGIEYGCTICSGKDKPLKETIEYSYWAKFDGHCQECDLPISIGQRCSKTTKGRNLHEECAPS